MSKAIEENNWKVTIKRLAWDFNLYWKFMCAYKNSDRNKVNWCPPPFHSFLNCWKIAKSTKALKKSFSLFLLTFCEKISIIAWVDYFVLQICGRWVENKHFFNFYVLNSFMTEAVIIYKSVNQWTGFYIITASVIFIASLNLLKLLTVCQVSSQYMAVLYPKKNMVPFL